MKFLLVLVAAIAVVQCQFTAEQKEKMKTYSSDCITESGAEKELLKSVRKGEDIHDDKVNSYFHCMMKKMHFQNDDGTFNVDTIITKFPEGVDKSKATEVVKKCSSGHEGHTKEEAATHAYKCFSTSIGEQGKLFAIFS